MKVKTILTLFPTCILFIITLVSCENSGDCINSTSGVRAECYYYDSSIPGWSYGFVNDNCECVGNFPTINSMKSTNPTDCNNHDGSIVINASGGETPLQYSIDGGDTYHDNNVFQDLSVGSYTIRVRNARGTHFTENDANQILTCGF